MILQMNFLRTVSALEDYNEVKQHQASNLFRVKNFWACYKSYHQKGQKCNQLKYTAILLSHWINRFLCYFLTNDLPLFPKTPRASSLGPHSPLAWSQDSFQIIQCLMKSLAWSLLTLGMLTLDQNSSKCSLILVGLYLEYRIANSVNMPMWARSRPNAASIKDMSSSK